MQIKAPIVHVLEVLTIPVEQVLQDQTTANYKFKLAVYWFCLIGKQRSDLTVSYYNF